MATRTGNSATKVTLPHKPLVLPPESPPSAVRPVGFVRFVRAVDVPNLGLQRELTAGGNCNLHGNPVGTPIPVPAMYRDGDTQELVIGTRRYPLASGIIESYELSRMAKGAPGDSQS